MFNYVSVSTAQVAAAITPASAFPFFTVPVGNQIKALCVDNGFNVDVVVMIDQSQPIYLRAGVVKTLDLTTDNAQVVSGQTTPQTLSVFAVAGTGPSSGVFLADCMF